ncbi:MAG TPA: rhodanese-like domain-containing protein [Planctomycetota bacterium]|nr:rhodanese-like domain-containing protein [Planctomycetota bacterium]
MPTSISLRRSHGLPWNLRRKRAGGSGVAATGGLNNRHTPAHSRPEQALDHFLRWVIHRRTPIACGGGDIMVIHANDLELAKQWFASKLASEKAKNDVVKKVTEGEGDFVLLDARDRASYEKAHIPGAISVPAGDVERALQALDREQEYVTYCWNRT